MHDLITFYLPPPVSSILSPTFCLLHIFLAREDKPKAQKSREHRDMGSKKIIWQISDGKRGHENQSAGLIDALCRLQELKIVKLGIDQYRASWLRALFGSFPPASILPPPDLIIGTGSQTHATLLAAGRATGTPTIVMMAPPRGLSRCFNLCIIPEHDNRTGANVLNTKGAINLIRPSQTKDADAGLFLIGGPSAHHDWDEVALLDQIDTILKAEDRTRWTLTTSRRTPNTTTQQLQSINHPRLNVVPVDDTSPTWLPDQLATASKVWVTEDSVSMVYEALSSDAKVGLLQVPRKSTRSRVIRGLDHLIEADYIQPYDATRPDLEQFTKPPVLNEAKRIAQLVEQQFLSKNGNA